MPLSHPGASQAGYLQPLGIGQQDPFLVLSNFPWGKYKIVGEATLGKLTSWAWFHIYLLSDVHCSPAQDKLISCLLISLAPSPAQEKEPTGHQPLLPRAPSCTSPGVAASVQGELLPLQVFQQWPGSLSFWRAGHQDYANALRGPHSALIPGSGGLGCGGRNARCGVRILARSLPKLYDLQQVTSHL